MGGKCRCPDPPAMVPEWFMTYSDVITLLMTFFILLLTFATNEPERFERMQVAVFGSGGATGAAGENDSSVDRESVVSRMRPKVARLTTRGSEMPPLETDPVPRSLAKGLKSLENPNELADSERVGVDVLLTMFRKSDGDLTSLGQQYMRMMAIRMKKSSMEIQFQVSRQEDAEFCVEVAENLVNVSKVPPGRIAISLVSPDVVPEDQLRIQLVRTLP